MDEKRALKIDLEELCLAMENNSYDLDYYLDLETGEVIFISDYMDDANLEELKDRIDENPDRYEPIPKAESYEDYDDMVDFISTVEDEHLVELLEIAIDGKVPSAGLKMSWLAIPRKRRGGIVLKMRE